MKTFRCKVCGHVFQSDEANPICPVCKKGGDALEVIDEKPSLKGTQTEKNLQTAFAGESQARNKYTYFASVAKKEGYEQIAALFLETADNEKEHAKLWFKALGELGSTAENLKAAAAGENYRHTRRKTGTAAGTDVLHRSSGIPLGKPGREKPQPRKALCAVPVFAGQCRIFQHAQIPD